MWRPSAAGGGAAVFARGFLSPVGPSLGIVLILVFFIAQTAARLGDVFPILQPIKLGVLSQVAFVVVLLNRRSQRILGAALQDWSVRAVLVLVLLALVTLPSGVWPGSSVRFLTNVYYSVLFLFCAAILAFSDRRARFWVIVAIIVTAGVAAAKPYLLGYGGRYMIGYTYDENVTASFFVMFMPWAAAWAVVDKSRWRWIPLLALPLMMAAMVRTGSRGGLIGFLGLLPFLYSVAPPKRRAAVAALIAFASILFAVFAQDKLSALGKTLIDKEDYNYEHRDGRIELWKRGIGYVKERPLRGVGIDGFHYKELNTKIALFGGGKDMAAHNMYLEVAVDLGLLGFAAFMTACLSSLAALLRVRSRAARRFSLSGSEADEELAVSAGAAAASLLSLMITGFFLSLAYSALIYFSWGVAVGLSLADSLRTRGGTPWAPAQPMPVAARRTLAVGPGWRTERSRQWWVRAQRGLDADRV